jgi:DMSO/TMAO reductase YedYZ molybdopterin-dependent catalytic subunit
MGVEQVAAGTPVGRRVVLGMLGLGTAGVLLGARVQEAISKVLTPLDRVGVTELIPSGARFRFYSVVGFSPSRSRTAYRLKVTGLVDKPLTLSIEQLEAMAPTLLTKDFQCVTGWRVRDVKWVGVQLAAVLDAAGVRPEGKAITFKSFDGRYTESLTMGQARRNDVIVAYRMDGKGVSQAHGGPVRLYVAPMYGYKSCKWLEEIHVVDRVTPGYWEVRGYDVDAWIGRSNGRDDQPV